MSMDLDLAHDTLVKYLETLDHARRARARRPDHDEAERQTPLAREVLRRLRPGLGNFKTGGLSVWDKARKATVEGLGQTDVLRNAAIWLGPAEDDRVAKLHPRVAGVSRSHMEHGEWATAVHLAAEAINQELAAKSGLNNKSGTALWHAAFGQSRLTYGGPGNEHTRESIAEGLRSLGAGTTQAFRNPAAHADAELDENDAIEQLCALSQVARLLDRCTLAPRDDPDQ